MSLLDSLNNEDRVLLKRASILLASFSAVMIVCGWTAMYMTRLKQPVIVPKVIGMEQKEAEKTLRSKGLQMTIARAQFDERMPVGSVVLQVPRANNYVKRKETVEVVLSKGKPRLPAPDVVNQTFRRAQILLNQAQLRVGQRAFMSSGIVPKDTILAQVPMSGEIADGTGAVNLLISTGPLDLVYAMPDLRRQALERAFQLLRTATVMVEKIITRVQDDIPPGTIIAQNPDPGSRLEGNSSVTLTVSTNSAEASLKARFVVFTYAMPEGPPRRLRIDILDSTGTRTVYNKMEESGNQIRLEISVTGKTVAQIYFNQQYDREIPIE